LAVLIVATTPLFFAFARLVIFDMPLALFVSLAIFTGYLAEEPERDSRLWYALSWTAIGFATLIKGPIGLALPVLVLGVLNLTEKHRERWKRLFHPLNILIFAILVLPWFIGVTLQYPDFPYYGLVRESLDRLTTQDFGRTRPFYFYLPVILGAFFPWSLLLPEGILLTWRKREQWRRPDRLLVIWAIVVVVFFSLPRSKLPGYILTAVVALGVLTARGFARAFARREGEDARLILRATLALGLIAFVGSALIAWDAANPAVAAMFGARGRYVAALSPAFPLLAACFLATALVALTAFWRRRIGLAFLAFLLFPVLVTTIGFPLFQDYAASHSTRALAERLAPLPRNVRIVCFECFPDGVPFYIRRRIVVVTKDGNELTSNYIRFTLNRGRHWPKVLVPLDAFPHWLATRRYPIYLLAKDNQNQMLRRVAAEYGGAVKRLPLGYGAVLLSQPAKGGAMRD
jgi:4-amino-4-deoxy-L-arabinose transferase-like glycosyltransferase